jgi:hypothetical protein
MPSSFNNTARGRPRATPPAKESSPLTDGDDEGGRKTRKKILSWQAGGQQGWSSFDSYIEQPQPKSRKLTANPRVGPSSGKKPKVEDLYASFNPNSVLNKSVNGSANKTNQHPLPKLQKSKLLAPALPDPKLCRWRSAFFFDPPVNKEVYEGEMLNNMRDGQGVFLYKNGNTYEGSWKKNYEHGRGVLFNKKRQVIYSGEFDKGKVRE